MADKRIHRLALLIAALAPSLNAMEDAARRHLTNSTGCAEESHCQQWVRGVYEDCYGGKFAQFQRHYAIQAAEAWKDSPYSLDDPSQHSVGDILYFTTDHGPDGHVVIRIQGNQVAENSCVHWDGVDSRGVRPLADFGDPDVVVRLWS